MPLRLHRCGSTRGFTMVEVLVVISIITILAGLLLPVIGNVRDTGERVKCLTNTRYVGKAILDGFIPDHSDYLPHVRSVINGYAGPTTSNDRATQGDWDTRTGDGSAASGVDAPTGPTVGEYVGLFPQASASAPLAKNMPVGAGTALMPKTIITCPGAVMKTLAGADVEYYPTYGLNLYYGGGTPTDRHNAGATRGGRAKLSAVKRPLDVILVGDKTVYGEGMTANPVNSYDAEISTSTVYDGAFPTDSLGRHGNSFNYTFMDQHAEAWDGNHILNQDDVVATGEALPYYDDLDF